MAANLFSAYLEALENAHFISSSGPASMTRIQPSASPTPSRAWRAIAALTLSLVLAPVAMADEPTASSAAPAAATAPAAPAAAPAADAQAPAANATAATPADATPPADSNVQALVEDTSLGMAHDLSPWGMYKNADIVVKIVMIGLAIASIIT